MNITNNLLSFSYIGTKANGYGQQTSLPTNQTSNVGDDLCKSAPPQLELEKGDNAATSPVLLITSSMKKRNASKEATTSKSKSMRTKNDVSILETIQVVKEECRMIPVPPSLCMLKEAMKIVMAMSHLSTLIKKAKLSNILMVGHAYVCFLEMDEEIRIDWIKLELRNY